MSPVARRRARRGLAPLLLWLLAVPAEAEVDVAALAPYEGRRVTAVALEGHDVTRDFVIRRELRTKVGEPLAAATVSADAQRLDNLSIFADVAARAEGDGEGVQVVFVLREMPAWIPVLGMLYTEENGFSVGPGVSFMNLAGRDISLSARAYFGGTRQYWLRASWPWIARDHLSLEWYGARLDRDDTLNGFHEDSMEMTPRVGIYLGEHGRLHGMFSLFNLESDVDGKTLSPDNEDLLLRLGVALGTDTRDSWTLPRDGWQNELELWYTGGVLGGDGDSLAVNLDLRRWIPVAARQRLQASSLLSLQTGEVGVDVPVYFTYHLGGANSIRGYDIDELGRELFGKNQLIGTLEYSWNVVPQRRRDFKKWSVKLGFDLAVFADGGIAWDESEQFALRRARGGLGAGLRILIPGQEMIRLDVGWSPHGGINFHFAGGTKPVAQRMRLR
jgi:outer membrane protein assembly factor BamA